MYKNQKNLLFKLYNKVLIHLIWKILLGISVFQATRMMKRDF